MANSKRLGIARRKKGKAPIAPITAKVQGSVLGSARNTRDAAIDLAEREYHETCWKAYAVLEQARKDAKDAYRSRIKAA